MSLLLVFLVLLFSSLLLFFFDKLNKETYNDSKTQNVCIHTSINKLKWFQIKWKTVFSPPFSPLQIQAQYHSIMIISCCSYSFINKKIKQLILLLLLSVVLFPFQVVLYMYILMWIKNLFLIFMKLKWEVLPSRYNDMDSSKCIYWMKPWAIRFVFLRAT